jgi:6-phosphogluconolactonase (cycloisomerase 2 family)
MFSDAKGNEMNVRVKSVLAVAAVAIVSIWAAGAPEKVPQPKEGTSRLVAVREVPALRMCEWEQPAAASPALMASLQQENPLAALPRTAASLLMAPFQAQGMTEADWEKAVPASLRRRGDLFEPQRNGNSVRVRTIADTYPTYTAVGVNLQTDEVFLQDNNLWSYRVFNRLDNTPAGAEMTRPKRIVQGPATNIQFNNGIYIDQKDGKVYSVESDTGDKMVAFAGESSGDVTPRILHTPHRVYSIAADEVKDELYMTVEFPPQIVVYRKQAAGEEQPLRRIRGDRTLLETPHGIAIDQKNRLLFVNNWGQGINFDDAESGVQGTGRFNPPSITVYSLDAEGNAPPLRVIQGQKTQLNWPGNMAFDQEVSELYVANDVGHAVLVFNGLTSAKGDVPPARVIKGDKTNLFYPTGVFVDAKHQELWVSNLGSSSVNVFPLKADGNVTPLRTIRSAPQGHRSLTFGRPAAIAYDRNREEILVPN